MSNTKKWEFDLPEPELTPAEIRRQLLSLQEVTGQRPIREQYRGPKKLYTVAGELVSDEVILLLDSKDQELVRDKANDEGILTSAVVKKIWDLGVSAVQLDPKMLAVILSNGMAQK